jgi:hypothetical protein
MAQTPRAMPMRLPSFDVEVLTDAFLTLVRAPTSRYTDHRRALWEVLLWFQHPDMAAPVNLSDCCGALNLDVGWAQAVASRLSGRTPLTRQPPRVPARLERRHLQTAGLKT